MAVPLITKITFEEEIALNNPMHSLEYVAKRYRESKDEALGHGLYEDEPITFANVNIISEAATYFKKYGAYNDIHPTSRHYKLWWDREEYRRKKGVTVPIKVPPGGANSDKDLLPVWIPGIYYGHLNYGPIKRVIDTSTLDTDKVLKNTVEEAFELDKELEVDKLLAGLTDKSVAEKDYDFPDFWDGHFGFYLAADFARRIGLDMATLKGRRKGFSYIGAWIANNTYDLVPNSLSLLIASDIKYLNKGKEALFNMVRNYADFINEHTDWKKSRLIDNAINMKAGYTKNGVDGEFGRKSEVLCLSAADNPNCARGKDATIVLYEESGSFPNLTETRTSTKAAAETGGYVVGQSFYWGTVGKNEADMAGLVDIYYNPFAADCLPYRNKWSDNPESETSCLFFGQYQNLIGAIDKNGNSNYEEAKAMDDLQDKVKRRGNGYHSWRAERPRTPEEALSPATNNLFKQYHDIVTLGIEKLQTTHKDFGRCGKYMEVKGQIIFYTNAELEAKSYNFHPPINDIPKLLPKDYDKHGCIVEWSTPHTIHDDEGLDRVNTYVPENLYVIWHDPFATDKDEKEITLQNSDGVSYVYEIPNNITKTKGGRIVASWIGRPDTTDAYNEQLFYMARRWNAKILYENDRGVVYEYALPRKLTKWLIEEPELLSMKELSGKTGRKYGLSIGKHPQRKVKGLLMLHDFCKEPLGVDDFGGTVTFLHTFYCKRGLREFLKYRSVGNFDCISTLIIGMYYIRENFDMELKEKEDTLNLDDFWSRSHF